MVRNPVTELAKTVYSTFFGAPKEALSRAGGEVVDRIVEPMKRAAPIIILGVPLVIGGTYYAYRKINDMAERPTGPLIGIDPLQSVTAIPGPIGGKGGFFG